MYLSLCKDPTAGDLCGCYSTAIFTLSLPILATTTVPDCAAKGLYKNPCDSWHVTPCWELCYLLISLPSFHLQRYKKNPKYASKIMFIFLIFNSFYERQMRSDNWTLSCYCFVIIWVRQTYRSSYHENVGGGCHDFSFECSRVVRLASCLRGSLMHKGQPQGIRWRV